MSYADTEALLPNKALSNVELLDAAKKIDIPGFAGVFVRDNLPRKPGKVECGILNLDDASGKGLTGWLGVGQARINSASIAMVFNHRLS